MNIFFLVAGILCFLLGIVHSYLGERLIFSSKRKSGHLVPTLTNDNFRERHLRIMWVTWHLTSIFGWCIGALIVAVSFNQIELDTNLIIKIIISPMFFSSLLVLVGTKGKHPGWVVLLIIAILLILGIMV